MKHKRTTASLAICLALSASSASADDNFPDKDDHRSVDSVIVAAIESVEISKHAIIDFGTYDENEDAAQQAIDRIKVQGHYMQRDLRGRHIFSMGIIMEQVKAMESRAVRAFVDERGGYCILMHDGEYEARSGVGLREAAIFCRRYPDWKRYVGEVRSSNSTAETGDAAK